MANVILKKGDFIDLGIFKNVSWKGNFSDREIFENAETNYSNYLSIKQGETDFKEEFEFLREQLKEDILYEIIGTPAYKWHERMINGLTF